MVGSSCLAKRPLAVEAGEDAERVNALRHAAAQGHVAIAQPQHLHALDDARVARRTGGAERVVRAGDAQVQRNLAGRIVGHGARVVVVRPVLRVVVVALEQEDFVLGLDVAVLGHADVDADASSGRRSSQSSPASATASLRAVDADAAGPGAAADLLAFLVAQLVEVADPRQRGAEVADFVRHDAAAARQQAFAELRQRIPVRRGQSHARNDNPLLIRPLGNHASIRGQEGSCQTTQFCPV